MPVTDVFRQQYHELMQMAGLTCQIHAFKLVFQSGAIFFQLFALLIKRLNFLFRFLLMMQFQNRQLFSGAQLPCAVNATDQNTLRSVVQVSRYLQTDIEEALFLLLIQQADAVVQADMMPFQQLADACGLHVGIRPGNA